MCCVGHLQPRGRKIKRGFPGVSSRSKGKFLCVPLNWIFGKLWDFVQTGLIYQFQGLLFGKNMAKQFGQGPFLPPLPIFRAIPERKHFLWEVFPNSLTQAGNCLVLSHLLNRLQTMKVRRSTNSKVCGLSDKCSGLTPRTTRGPHPAPHILCRQTSSL